jgi:hypothetical protein
VEQQANLRFFLGMGKQLLKGTKVLNTIDVNETVLYLQMVQKIPFAT